MKSVFVSIIRNDSDLLLSLLFLFLIAPGQWSWVHCIFALAFVLIFGSLNVKVLSLSGESLMKHNWTVFGKLQSLCFETTTK